MVLFVGLGVRRVREKIYDRFEKLKYDRFTTLFTRRRRYDPLKP